MDETAPSLQKIFGFEFLNLFLRNKKINIAGLRKLLVPAIEKEEYIKFELSKPSIERDVIVKFTAQDNKVDRCEYDSIHNFRKIFKSVLTETNWRLMSEGISYRLGILSGRLRGHEDENGLIKLVKINGK